MVLVVAMPYKDPAKQREAVRAAAQRYRERMREDADFLRAEAERKARWYAANKEKKNEAQRRYRQRLKEVSLA